jgi:2-polyprenyl-3-methyl-5-hydroxy-6-metoxy-1,4-benzoquinol methylase
LFLVFIFLQYRAHKLKYSRHIKNYCPICNELIFKKVTNWSFYCTRCDYWAAFLQKNIESLDDNVFKECKNKDEIISFLDDIRKDNFSIILDYLITIKENEKLHILDIGCATGLFITMAKERGFESTGVEPNKVMAKSAANRKLNVRHGYFPKVLGKNERFDVITLNDVFEHVENLGVLLNDIKKHLNYNGVLIVNLPNSNGILFNFGMLLASLNMYSLWNRLWQTMFYTPHLHYFNPKSLNLLLSKYKFTPISTDYNMNFMSFSGLWRRVCVDKNLSKTKQISFFVGAVIITFLLKIIKRDAFFIAYKIM